MALPISHRPVGLRALPQPCSCQNAHPLRLPLCRLPLPLLMDRSGVSGESFGGLVKEFTFRERDGPQGCVWGNPHLLRQALHRACDPHGAGEHSCVLLGLTPWHTFPWWERPCVRCYVDQACLECQSPLWSLTHSLVFTIGSCAFLV